MATRVSKALNVEIVNDVDQTSFENAVAPATAGLISNPKAHNLMVRIREAP
jgi:hypothetical protein